MRYLLIFAALICSSTATAANPWLLRFPDPVQELGEIREADGEIEVTFEFENIAQEPVVIVEVRSTCNCAVTDYDRKAVQPGKHGKVKVIFDPVDMDGDFSKHLVVLASNGSYRKFSTLTLEGHVISRIPPLERDYPIVFSDVLRCDRDVLGMRLIAPEGFSMQRTARIVNTSGREIRLGASCDNDNIVVFMPQTLAADESTEIRVAVDGQIAPAGETFESELYITADGTSGLPLMIRGAVGNPK
ncbi:DUF1573 domain-containing protein [uncultured Alistipes sp.]|jgi:hypothetical protein|uniref:DUF1573 domain-containing protein n=1 Tax=uncultured Alistipes sp. TaxID=538949 RepID=UPI0025F32C9D|nr:DUF1573 domain-containing protein [uncultured Alistipes sp.]